MFSLFESYKCLRIISSLHMWTLQHNKNKAVNQHSLGCDWTQRWFYDLYWQVILFQAEVLFRCWEKKKEKKIEKITSWSKPFT